MNDVLVNKVQSIQRCVYRAREEYRAAGKQFANDYTRQDAAILNVTRACEQAIDLANHAIRTAKIGIPADSAESFELLVRAGIIVPELAGKLKKMVGFRNTVIHEYQVVDVRIVEAVIDTGLDDLLAFAAQMLDREASSRGDIC
jgi:uncharacterized protein YutE (UPF0331/DUF86 family)